MTNSSKCNIIDYLRTGEKLFPVDAKLRKQIKDM